MRVSAVTMPGAEPRPLLADPSSTLCHRLRVPTYTGLAPDLGPHGAAGACPGLCLFLISAHRAFGTWSSAPAWLCSALRPTQASQNTH